MARQSRPSGTSSRCTLPGLLGIALILFGALSPTSAQPPPIQIIWDLHMDPLPGIPMPQRLALYTSWRDAADWALDTAETRGAKITFLSVGEYMEFTLEDSANGFPLIERLYASGGTIGTHSHTEKQIGPHQWINLPPNPPEADVLECWADHISLVDEVVEQALGMTDPAAIRAVNNSRGSHIPGDDQARLDLMEQYGFTIHQQGPDEEFFAYFKHYVMNAYRPSGTNMLSHDPAGPVVDSPTGSVLGLNQVHFGILQDMRLPAHQTRFIIELLNWLDDLFVAHTDRVWTYGWGSHGSDVVPGQATRDAIPPMLDWLKTNFIDQTVSGVTLAAFSSSRESRDLLYSWEASHPGETPFDYPADVTDWALYPYLLPVARYLVDGQYVSATSIGQARLHRVTAAADAGGPYDIYIAYPALGQDMWADLTSIFGTGQIAAVDPRTGLAPPVATSNVPVPRTGVMLVPVVKRLALPNGDVNIDGYLDGLDIALFTAAVTGVDTDPDHIAAADLNRSGEVNMLDLPLFVEAMLE